LTAQGFSDADDTTAAHLCFYHEREVWVASPKVDARQRPTTLPQDMVGSDGTGKAQCCCPFTRPVLEDTVCAADGDTIRPFSTKIILADQGYRLTKVMCSTLYRITEWQVVVQ